MLRRFVGDPELPSIHREPRDHGTVRRFDLEHLGGAERILVELERSSALTHREHRRDRIGDLRASFRVPGHLSPSTFRSCSVTAHYFRDVSRLFRPVNYTPLRNAGDASLSS